MIRSPYVALTVAIWLGFPGDASGQTTKPADPAIADLVEQAEAIRPMVETRAVHDLLDEVSDLPTIEPRTFWYRRAPQAALTNEQYDALAETEREGFSQMEFDTGRYYETFYGTPLASMRAFDLVAREGGIDSYRGLRIMDIGFGTIGQLRLLAQVGAHAMGVDVQPAFDVLYGWPGDRGQVEVKGGDPGSVDMAIGLWPRDTGDRVGDGYDLIISKNTLKKGYVTPEESTAGRGIDLSVTVDEYVAALGGALKPGGLLMIYNIGPGPAPDGRGTDDTGAPTYLQMADVRCPFTPEQWDAAGFEVIHLDVDDTDMVRKFAHAFGWDDAEVMGQGAMNLKDDLFSMYTIARKR